MRLEAADPKRSRPFDAVEMLNLRFRDASAEDVIAGVRAEFGNEVALVSSFGAEAAVLLHLASRVDTGLPVLFIDTLMLFEETLEYQKTLSKAFGLTNVIHLRTDSEDLEEPGPGLDAAQARSGCLLPYPQGPAARTRSGYLVGGGFGSQAVSVQHALRSRDIRGGWRPAEGQSARALECGGSQGLHGPARSAAAPAGGEGVSIHRVRPLHHAGSGRRGPARRSLARVEQG